MKAKYLSPLRLLPYLVVMIIGVPIAGMAVNEGLKISGYKTIPVEVVGTGSMYPSLFWSTTEGGPEDESSTIIEEYRTTPHLYRYYQGLKFTGKKLFKRQLGYGDLVAFKNDKTREILSKDQKDQNNGFIKRIIALPGDRVELRDGFVYLNHQLLSEPYIFSPRSTYGGTNLKDCALYVVPQNSYFVLGDNRKVSSDSRFELGVINEKDIEFVLPYKEQTIYHSLWRDTSKDNALIGQPTLSTAEFLDLVNKERASLKIPPLTVQKSLLKSSSIRADKLLQNQNTTYSMQQAMSSAGYSNIVLGEFVSHGHFSASELMDNLLYGEGSSKQILNKEYMDLGISVISKDVEGCPTQIIVGHLGGYIPAVYDATTIKNWESLSANLAEVIPSWEKALGYNTIDQAKLQQLLSILRARQSLSNEILTVMNQKKWLSKSQEDRIKQDQLDAQTAEKLANEINKQ